MVNERISREDVIAMLRKRQGERSQAAFAEELGISSVYLGDVYKGHRNVGPAILSSLGLESETEVIYWKVV